VAGAAGGGAVATGGAGAGLGVEATAAAGGFGAGDVCGLDVDAQPATSSRMSDEETVDFMR
jgi:hypothetical protein